MMNSPYWGFGSGIVMILFWALIIWLLYSLVRGGGRHGFRDYKGHRQERSALDILKERYAKGEINKMEYEEKKKDLGY